MASTFAVIYIPLPLNASLYMSVSAPEQVLSSETRDVKWRPNVMPSVAVMLGWDYPRKWFLGSGMLPNGNTGLSLKLETIQMSNAGTASTPLKGVVFWYVSDVRGMGFSGPKVETPSFLRFRPVQKPVTWFYQMESAEPAVKQPGAIGDTPTQIQKETESTKDVPVTSDIETTKSEGKTPAMAVSVTKNNVKVPSQKFIFLQRVKISTADMGKPITVLFKPSSRTKRGEDIGLPFRRNVWATGESQDGFVRSCEFKVTSSRSPQITGLLQVRVLEPQLNQLGYACKYHELGGEATTIVAPAKIHEPTGLTSRSVATPWYLASQATYAITIHTLCVNRTTEANEATLNIYVRCPYTRFSVPIKPRKTPKPVVSGTSEESTPSGRDVYLLSQLADQLMSIVPLGDLSLENE